jgi:hypothetical protein
VGIFACAVIKPTRTNTEGIVTVSARHFPSAS